MYEENVEWIFNQDVREKKRTGNGIHGRAARLRKHESVKMPSEQEPDKFQRRLILGAGPCFVTSLKGMILMEWMDKIENGEWISIEQLKDLPFDDGQKIYARIRTLHTTAEMYKGFGCSSAQISELSWHFQVARSGKTIVVGEPALEILRGFTEHRQNQAEQKRIKNNSPRSSKKDSDKPKRKYKSREVKTNGESQESKNELAISQIYQEEIPSNEITLVEIKDPEIELLRMAVRNTYSSEQVIALLTRISLFVEGQENQFEVNLILQEKAI
jgi:hypothetical protein